MKDRNKTKEQLINEVEELRKRFAQFELAEKERKRVEEAAKESEETLHSLLDSMNDLVFVIGSDGTFKNYYQPSHQGDLYTPSSEFVGKNFKDFLPPDVAEPLQAAISELLTSGKTQQFEYRLEVKGAVKWWEAKLSPVRDSSGAITGVVAVSRENTERRRLEHDLNERLKELNCLYSLSRLVERPDVTLDELCQDISSLLVANYNYPEITCARVTFDSSEFRTDNWRDTPWKQSSDIEVSGKRVGIVEVCYLEERPDIDEGPFLDEERLLIQLVAQRLGRTIERKQAEETLWESEEFSSSLLTNSPIPMLVMNLDTSVKYVNPAMEELTGFSSAEVIGRKAPYPWWTKETLRKTSADLRKAMRQGAVRREELFQKKSGERFWVEITSTPVIHNGEFKYYLANWVDTTERKRAEEALKKSEERYRTLTENAGEAIFVVQDDVVKFVNPKGVELSGYSAKELISRPFVGFIHPDDIPMVADHHLKRLRREPVPQTYDFRIIKKDGDIRWGELNAASISWEDRPAVLCCMNDITERKQAEQALLDEATRWHILMEQSRDGIVILDQDGHVYDCNQKFADMVGYPLESMHQLTVLDWEYLYPPERVLEMIHNVDEKGDHFETKHRRKDGSTYGVEISTNAAVFAGQKLIFCICRDITKRKQIEEALRQSEQKLTIMFDSLPEGITVTDIDGKIVQLNSATARMHGYRKQGELIGKSAFVLISKGDHANAADSLKRTLETGLSGILEYKFVRKDGSTFPARLNASLMKDTSGKPTGFIAITTDITEEKRKEEAKQRAEQLAQVSSRLAIVGQMASGIAHEINNPLTGVIGFANLLLRKDIPEAVRKDIEIIRYNAQRVASIVQRLLIFARWQKPQRERVDINAIVSTTVAMRAYEMKANNIEVTMQLAPDLPQTVADGGQMQEVFLNIILNAETEMKLAHNKGNLLIKTERIDNTIRISFKDDGPGIPPENLERIFEPFFTTREVGQGTGLGLSISHGIIAEHDGQIYAQSKPGKGATLIVELPIVSAAQVCEVVEPLADEANNEITGHILIVDDEPVVRELLSEILTDRGHEVETVDNATDALKKLETERYSLILLDIKMPSMSGIEFYGHVKDKAKSLAKRIVFITGDAMGKETWHFLRQTKAPYLTKPFDEEQLDMVIGRISGR